MSLRDGRGLREAKSGRERVKGLLRVGAYFATLGLFVGCLQARAARADVASRTVTLGRQMERLANASQHDVNKITVNGQGMWLGSSLSRDPVQSVLDRYEAYCEQESAQPAEEWRALAEKPGEGGAKPSRSVLPNGVLRGGDAREGAVTCFTKTASSKPTIGAAMRAFAETGNLGELGAARYVYAKVTEKGNTLVLTGWTDDVFDIRKLVPEGDQEVPGDDFPTLPRPPSSVRVFSARVEGTPFGLNVYRGAEPPSAVASFYDETLGDKGYLPFDANLERRANPSGLPRVGRLYEKDGVILTLVSRREDEHKTFTALGLAGVGEGGGPEREANDPTGGAAGSTGAKPRR